MKTEKAKNLKNANDNKGRRQAVKRLCFGTKD